MNEVWLWSFVAMILMTKSEKNLSQCHFIHHKTYMDGLSRGLRDRWLTAGTITWPSYNRDYKFSAWPVWTMFWIRPLALSSASHGRFCLAWRTRNLWFNIIYCRHSVFCYKMKLSKYCSCSSLTCNPVCIFLSIFTFNVHLNISKTIYSLFLGICLSL